MQLTFGASFNNASEAAIFFGKMSELFSDTESDFANLLKAPEPPALKAPRAKSAIVKAPPESVVDEPVEELTTESDEEPGQDWDGESQDPEDEKKKVKASRKSAAAKVSEAVHAPHRKVPKQTPLMHKQEMVEFCRVSTNKLLDPSSKNASANRKAMKRIWSDNGINGTLGNASVEQVEGVYSALKEMVSEINAEDTKDAIFEKKTPASKKRKQTTTEKAIDDEIPF